MIIFAIFLKKWQVFGNFFTFKWQFSRGSGLNVMSLGLASATIHHAVTSVEHRHDTYAKAQGSGAQVSVEVHEKT